MAEIKYKFDYTEPENVESQVPGEQKIRESLNNSDSAIENATEWDENKIENPEDYTLAPVVTITKNEATFTKGDMKLQKVSVTENISEIRNGVFHTIKAPSYPSIHSEVIQDCPIRMDHSSQSEAGDRSHRPIRRLETQSSQSEERRTRIPTRFKNAVNRVRRERSMPAKNINEPLPTHPRRSSIPKLKPKSPPPKLEDEFERLFGEIANSPTDIDISLLNNKVDNPEQVEDCFEEIIHAYDEDNIHPIAVESPKQYNENNVQPVTIEKPKQSKIPMFKRKSEPEIEVPKSVQAGTKIARPLSDKNRFKDTVSKVTKTNANESKLPSKIAVTKRVNVESDNAKLKTSYQRVRSISRDGKNHEVLFENIVKVSLEQDISPYNVVTIDNIGASKALKSTVEIIEMSPVEETVDFADEITVQPYSIEILDSPISPVVENLQNNVLQIEEVTENEPKVEVFRDVISTIENKTPIDKVKVVSEHEFHNVVSKNWEENDKLKPVIDVNRNGTDFSSDNNISNLAKKRLNTEVEIVQNKITNKETKTYDYSIDDKKIQLRRTIRLDSKKETNEDDDNVIQHKSVLSKIAMFEQHRQEDKKNLGLRPKPAVRCSYRRRFAEEEVLEPETSISSPKTSQDFATDDLDKTKSKLSTTNIPDYKIRHKEPESNITNPKISKDDVTDDDLDEIAPELPKSKIPEQIITYLEPESITFNPIISKNDITDAKPKLLTSEIPESEIRHLNIDSKPIIVSEVIKLVQPNTYSNDIYSDINSPVQIGTIKFEDNNNVTKSESLLLSTMEIRTEEPVPVSNAVVENIFENQTVVSEIKEDVINYDLAKTERVKRHNPNRYYSFEVDYSLENPAYVDKANEIEIKSLTPVEIEYAEPLNSNIMHEPKSKDHKVQNAVANKKNYEKPKSQYIRKDPNESPFDFTPKNRSNESRNLKLKPLMSTEEILNAYRARNDEYNLRKAKSVAELDLGDAVKGKVQNLIVRMKSMEKGVEKKDVISVKERPRKKSVSEKIALFEGVFSQATGRYVYNHGIREEQKRAEEVQARSEEEYQKHLEELTASKQTYGHATSMPKVELNNGEKMPVIAIGTALLDKRLAANIVATAIDLGYRAIDTAFIYGNEKEVGEGIRKKIDDGTVKREDLFVISKLWSTFHRRDLVEKAYKQSLENLGLDYVDLYLIHNPMSFKEGPNPLPMIAKVVQYSEHDYLDAWYGMEDLVTKGLVKSIGLSNFNSSQVQKVLDKARIKPAINQVECHPYLSQQRLYNFCDERHIKLSCFGVLGSKGTPAEYKNTTVAAIDDPMVQVMAAGLNVTPAQLLIRYQLQSDHTVVVKASSGAHMWDNLQALKVELTEVQMDALRALNRNKRIFAYKGMGDTHKNYPFNAAF